MSSNEISRQSFKTSHLAPLLRPVQAFIATESASGIVLIVCALIALAWANSPWGDVYQHFLNTEVSIGVSGHSFSMSLEHSVNDGLMVIFFLLVGLEIKRELLLGELASVRRATLPIAAAIGGMVVPASIYLMFNLGKTGASGWGVPMATDIAFAVGVLALVGRSAPISLKVFLLAIAIVDDLGAVAVIVIFYTGHISLIALAIAGVFLAALVVLNILRVHRPFPYICLGVGLWAAILASGIHATFAGVLLAFTIPASRQMDEESYVTYSRKMLNGLKRGRATAPDKITYYKSHSIKPIEEASQAVRTPLARVEHFLLIPVAFVIVPLFAIANAGIELRSGSMPLLSSPISWGVLLGLVVGKPLGVLLASWIAVKTGAATWPSGATVRQIIGVSILCGIGFTMSLFVANLGFADQSQHLAEAKLGILIASIVAGIGGGIVIAWPGKANRRI